MGDWIQIPVENRVCYTCMEVEDEAHFIFECPRYADLRGQYILQDFDPSRCAQVQLVELLLCRNRRKLDNLAIYIKKATIVRQFVVGVSCGSRQWL